MASERWTGWDALANSVTRDDDIRKTARRLCELNSQARRLREEIGVAKLAMIAHMVESDIRSLHVPDYGNIVLKESSSRKPTKGAIKDILGEDAGDSLWAQLPQNRYESLSIPELDPDGP